MHSLWVKYRDTSLVIKLSIGFAIGLLLALIFGDDANVLAPLGDLFLRLLQLIVIPIVVLTLITALTSAPPSSLARVGPKAVIYFTVTTLVAATLGIAAGKLVNPGQGIALPSTASEAPPMPETTSVADILLGLVPTNLFTALTDGNMLALIFVAIIVGLTVSTMRSSGDSQVAKNADFFTSMVAAANNVTFRILDGILQYAPFGVLGLAASTLGDQSTQALADLGIVLLTYVGATAVHMIVLYGGLLLLSGISIVKFVRTSASPMLTALTTGSSSGTLPVTLKAGHAAGISDGVRGFVLPLGATINMDGAAIRLSLYAVLAANVAGEELTLGTMAMLVLSTTAISIGAAGIPGAGPVVLTMLLSQAGLPLEIVGIVAGIDLILNQLSTMCNVTGDLVGAHVIDKSEKRLLKRHRSRSEAE